MYLLGLCGLLVGSGLLYLTHRNQIWLVAPLNTTYRWLGMLTFLFGCISFFFIMNISTAILSIALYSMVFFGLLPTLALFFPPHSKQGKRHAR